MLLGKTTFPAMSRDFRQLRLQTNKVSAPAERENPALSALRNDPTLPFRAMGWRADPWQVKFLNSPTVTRSSLLCSRQAGKALAVDTPIPTPDGWSTMGALRVGDRVYDQDGKPCVVEAVSPVDRRPAFRVKFSDGSSVVADGEHLWTTLDAAARAAIGRDVGELPADWWRWEGQGRAGPRARLVKACSFPGCEARHVARGFCSGHYQQEKAGRVLQPLRHPKPAARTLTTAGMAETLHRCERGDTNHSIPATAPLDGPDVLLPIDPYTLGAWLGDGHTDAGRITVGDTEVIDAVRAAGYEVRAGAEKGKATTYGVHGLQRQLRLAGLLGKKHIPPSYLRASFAQRLALLQGLMDTDGSCSAKNQRCEFVNINPVLAEGVRELAVSLGLVVTVGVGDAKLNGRVICGKYRVCFSPRGLPVFRVARKAARAANASPDRQMSRGLRFVTSIEPVGERDVRCIAVSSPSRLYLAGGSMIPTHNSTATAALLCREALLTLRRDFLVFCPTMRQSQEMLRKVREFYLAMGSPVAEVSSTKSVVEFANGSRIVCLPDSQEGVVGFSSPKMIVIDEGSRVSDELYKSVRPMLAASEGGRLITLSTPYGNQGWFFDIWDDTPEGILRRAKLRAPWQRIAVPAAMCPRITDDFLADERVELGQRWFNQEYNLVFLDAVDAVFSRATIEAARADDVEPLFSLDA